MLLFYVRHGDPIYDPNELTPLGKRQAEAVARRLARYGVDEIYMSSSNRAMQTAKPTCEILKKEATVLDWTNEDYAFADQSMELPDGGRVWGFIVPKFKDFLLSKEIRDLGSNWTKHPSLKDNSFATGHLRIQKDTREFLKTLGFEWDEEKGQYKNLNYSKQKSENWRAGVDDKRIALFAHHGFGMNFLSSVLDIPFPQICIKMGMEHSGISVLYFSEDSEYSVAQILTLSNDGHLIADNIPPKYDNWLYF